MDESMGMRNGKESGKKQSYGDRRDESMGMKDYKKSSGGFSVQDNQQSGVVHSISTNSEQYDLNRIKSYKQGSRGYPNEAWNYKY